MSFFNGSKVVQRFTLNDNIKHTSVVQLNIFSYVNILGIVTPMYGTERYTLNVHYKTHKSGSIKCCPSCEHIGYTNMDISSLD